MTTHVPYPVFDLHCDTADRLAWSALDDRLRGMADEGFAQMVGDVGGDLARNGCHVSLEGMGNVSWAQCFACFEPDELLPEDAAAFCEQVFSHLEGEVAAHADAVTLVRGARQIAPALDAGRKVAVLTIENARSFAFDLGLIHELAERGLLMASLSWNARGPLASGFDDEDAGLTRLGLDVLRLMEEERVILDVSHLNDVCFDDVCAHAERPFVASHSNSRAICGHPRNLTDAQFSEIRDRGGIVGLNYCVDFLADDGSDADFDAISYHLDHWVGLGGEGVIALGSDFDGCAVPSCIDGASMMPSFQTLLEARFGEDLARRLCGGNALAFFERWGR